MSDPTAQSISFYGYIFTFPLGLIGHIFSLMTFFSKTLRTTSTGFLFICLTISDILYQLMSIYDFIKQVPNVQLFINEYLCRFRTFILNFSTITSAWILVLISMDRLIRVRFPYQQGRICTRKIAALSVGIVCACSIATTSHVLQPEFGFSNPVLKLCGLPRTPLMPYQNFYNNVWPFLQLLITYFIPRCLMVISLVLIRMKVRMQQNQFLRSAHRARIEQQMFILMLSSIVCFSVCTLSYSIHRIVYQRSGVFDSATSIQIAILTIFLNMNYCYNFYIHCLTSNLFREKFIQEFKRIIQCWGRQTRTAVHPLTVTNRLRN